MHVMQFAHSLEINLDLAFNQQVQPVFADFHISVVINRRFQLLLDLQPALPQLKNQSVLIERLNEPRSQLAMHLNRRPYNIPRQFLKLQTHVPFSGFLVSLYIPKSHRSTSPKTMSTLPRITTVSETLWPRHMSSKTVKFMKLGGRTR